MSITNEPNATWMFSLGREGQIFVNRVNGEIVGSGNHDIRSLMSEFRNWHRWIALSGDNRPMGKAITGVSNLLFLFVAISGFYIWMPRKFNWKLLKPVVFFRQGLRGKARNFNWHNVIGFWTSLFLIIFTLTATVISYQWASNLLYTMTGNEVPKQSENSKEKPNETVLSDEVWQKAESQAPKWKSISLKLPVTSEGAVFTIDEGVYWNIFGRSNLTIDPATSSILKWEPYGDQNAGRQLRTWFRFTHTGETGGMIGQIVGFIVCIGACFLVWTGFSLAFRRFGKWIKKRKEPLPAEPV